MFFLDFYFFNIRQWSKPEASWAVCTFFNYLNFTLLGCSSSSSIRTSGSGLGLVDRHARTLVRARPARCRFPSSYERKNSQRETRFLVLVYQEHGGRFRLSLHSLRFFKPRNLHFFYSLKICALTQKNQY